MLSDQNSSAVRDVAHVPTLKSVTAFFKIRDGICVSVTAFFWYPVDTVEGKNAVGDPRNDSILENAVEKMLSDDAIFEFAFYRVFFNVFFKNAVG